jgi:hypothetical protein
LPVLLTAFHQLAAVVSGVLGAFDARDLAENDACRTAKTWLVSFGRMTPSAASAWVKRARLLGDLPALRAGALAGTVSADHLRKVLDLVDRVGLSVVVAFDEILANLAASVSPGQLQRACERIAAYIDPDGPHPDPHGAFERRGLTVSRVGNMMTVRGQLDPEAGAAFLTALDAAMAPPRGDDLRTPAQRRADALADIVAQVLGAGRLPTVHGVRPHVGILITPDALLPPDPANSTSDPARHSSDPSGLTPGPSSAAPDRSGPLSGAEPHGPRSARQAWDALTAAGVPGLPEAARLGWFGDIDATIAQRVACDCDVWRCVLDPATGLPLEVGRTHRIVPHWIRRALHARDQGCRFPGCTAPVAWTDAHHWKAWYEGGETNVENLLSLCRFHHVIVHEGRWTLTWDPSTGAVYAFRPDGTPYELGPSLPHVSPTRRRGDPPGPHRPASRRPAWRPGRRRVLVSHPARPGLP